MGGLHEIGKNITVLECGDDILIVDCGTTFPEDEMLGIDIVIPDFSYLLANRHKVKGLILTHGHEDHIGGVPYLLRDLPIPLYGSRLTLGLVQNKLKEHGIDGDLREIKDGDKVKIGIFEAEAIHMTHSIADALAYAISTPAGVIFHTGDFKIDYTPLEGKPIDFQKLASIGSEGVLLMLCDSTNVERKGYTPSERNVGVTLENIFRKCESSRILVATFSSNVNRVQKIIDTAVMCNRKVAISGRSMINVVGIAIELGYLKVPVGVLVDINKIKNYADSELVIITTGSQGEPMSALSRMASNEHKNVQLKQGDVVILSSSPIPGNEKAVSNIVNKLFAKGVEVIYSDIAETHVSGHACQEELKLIHMLLKPEFFMPVHGEYRHLRAHAQLAADLGMDPQKIFLSDNGQVMSLHKHKVEFANEHIECPAVLVDGFGIGDVGNAVLKDRKLLSEGGLIIVAATIDRDLGMVVSGPDIISKGFVYVKEAEDLLTVAAKVARDAMDRFDVSKMKDYGPMKSAVRNAMQDFIYKTTKRSPVIMPIFMEL
ncbi:MAG: ribonuclease J [Firmicutes bacterium]|nr:ribonuclease J [Bacillota bacterium]